MVFFKFGLVRVKHAWTLKVEMSGISCPTLLLPRKLKPKVGGCVCEVGGCVCVFSNPDSANWPPLCCVLLLCDLPWMFMAQNIPKMVYVTKVRCLIISQRGGMLSLMLSV